METMETKEGKNKPAQTQEWGRRSREKTEKNRRRSFEI